jgi:glycosyltransferase involved in cell wall biosynthesis
MWAKYKAVVFSELFRLATQREIQISIFHIAKTEKSRIGLSNVDLDAHEYPYIVKFDGAYGSVPVYQRMFALWQEAWKTEADLVLIAGYDKVEYWVQLLTLMLRHKRRGVFCDSTMPDRSRGPVKHLFKRWFFRRCNIILCYGIRSREYVMRHGVDSKRIVIRCQAAALPKSYDSSSVLRERRNIDRAQPRVLYVGRISSEKNIDVAISAIALLKQRNQLWNLRIVGIGPETRRLISLAKSLGVADCVEFVGAVDHEELGGEYLAATCLVLPSWSEPWGLVVNEALSYGCPVVVSDRCGCVPELVVAGATGFAFNPESAPELAEMFLRVSLELSDAENIAQQCIKHISPFSPEAAATMMLDGCLTALPQEI